MQQHAMRTAMTLYANGTLELEAAAGHAGVSTERLRSAVRRVGSTPPTSTADAERVRVHAD